MNSSFQVNMQYLADCIQKTCSSYIKHGDVRFNVNEETGEEHINFEGIMKTSLRNVIKKKYDIPMLDIYEDPEDETADYIKFIPVDDVKNFYYNIPWASVILYYRYNKVYGVFIFDSMDSTVLFCTTKEEDKGVRLYRNMSVSNFRARRINRGIYNVSSMDTDEIAVVKLKEPKKIISFFSPTLSILNVIKGNIDGMAAKIDNRSIIQAPCLICQKLGVDYTFKNDVFSIL